MIKMKIGVAAGLAAAFCALAACGGGGGAPASSIPPTVTSTLPGIWQGTDGATGLKVTAFIAETGYAHFILANGTQYIGTVFITGTSYSATFEEIPQFGATFPDGSIHGTGTMTGSFVAQQSITATETLTTAAGTTTSGAVSFTFDTLYNQPSYVAAINGNYTDPTTGVTLSISDIGVLTSQDTTTGCLTSGYVLLVDPNYNLYEFSVTRTGCQGAAAVLNGTTFIGFGTLNTSVTPNQLIIGVSGGVTQEYGFVYTLNKG